MSTQASSRPGTTKSARNDVPISHLHRRVFIGPQPEKVLVKVLDQDTHSFGNFRRPNAFRHFLHHDKSVERFEEDIDNVRMRNEMVNKWKESSWGQYIGGARQRLSKTTPKEHEWVGESFKVGTVGTSVEGFDFIEATEDALRQKMSASSTRGASLAVHVASQQSESTNRGQSPFSATAPPVSASNASQISVNGQEQAGASPSSSTQLLTNLGLARHPSKAASETQPRPILRLPSAMAKSDTRLHSLKRKGKQVVRYSDVVQEEEEVAPPLPTSPSEVLERAGTQVEDTSAGAAVADSPSSLFTGVDWNDVILRDRMLVRVNTSNEEVRAGFDESQMRSTPGLHYEGWGEFMVAWRKDRIELYEDYTLAPKEWFTSHKHLFHTIPLKKDGPRKTNLSLFSFVDLTFTITYSGKDTDKLNQTLTKLFGRTKETYYVFVFKPKSRSRAVDWMWQLWRYLGNQIPPTIDVRLPALDTTVKIDLPSVNPLQDNQLGISITRTNIIGLCTQILCDHEDWKLLIEEQVKRGKELELAWRVDTTLDWIWLENDINGDLRPWAVISGLALKQNKTPAHLEMRLGEHYPTHLLPDAYRENCNLIHTGEMHPSDPEDSKRTGCVTEPDAIEGYLHRIKPNTQVKQQLYVTVHDGYLFTINASHAHPPEPPCPPPPGEDIESYVYHFRKSEVARGAHQLIHAQTVCDLRDILAVRRAFQMVPNTDHGEEEVDNLHEPEVAAETDHSDEGGDAGLNKHQAEEEKSQLRMRRAFELLLKSGRVIRFETYSCRYAIEWINALRDLIRYWKRRNEVDAEEEMDLAQAHRARVTPRRHIHGDDDLTPPDPPPDVSAPMPALGLMYNWCVLEGCKPIIRGGRVYSRRGLRGQYKYIQLFLVQGQLLRFRVNGSSAFHTVTTKKINLTDAYVCSGYFAAIALPGGQYDPDAPATARRYADSLEANDREEDLLFAVWYRSNSPMTTTTEAICQEDPSKGASASVKSVPALSSKRKLALFRTRSKLERDAWCWALNCEIERIVRVQKERETKLRMTGGLVQS